MNKNLVKIIFYSSIVFFFINKICYADELDMKEVINPFHYDFLNIPFDFNIYIEYKYNLCNYYFENIDEFYSAYNNRNVIKIKSGIHYFYVSSMFVLGIG
jgi:hypothetical protein